MTEELITGMRYNIIMLSQSTALLLLVLISSFNFVVLEISSFKLLLLCEVL